jgi:hypothetical protein
LWIERYSGRRTTGAGVPFCAEIDFFEAFGFDDDYTVTG